MATGHVVSRSVRDSALLLDVTHGPAKGDPYHPPHFGGSYYSEHVKAPGSLRIALDVRPLSGKPVHPENIKGVHDIAALCESLGHRVEEHSPEFDIDAFGNATWNLVAANVCHTVRGRATSTGQAVNLDTVEAVTMNAFDFGSQLLAEDYVASLQRIHATGLILETFFEDYDLIMSPTLLQPPVPLGFLDTNSDDLFTYGDHMREFWGFTNLYNATGEPAISLPLHWSNEGLPVGIQFAAAFGNELLLLQLANQLEEARPWIDFRPSEEQVS